MASLALRSARPWRAMSMRDRPAGCASCAGRLCGALRGSGRPPRGGRRRSFVGGDRLLVANGRCWRRENRRRAPACATSVATRSAGWAALRPFRFRFIPRRATAQQRATNTPLAATRRHPRRHCAAAGDRHATRRHSPPHGDIGVVLGWWLLTALGFAHAPESAAAPYGTERPAEKGRRLPLWRQFLARAREGRGAGGAS